MAVGSIGFPNFLSRANIIGVAYGWERSEALGSTVPSISLVARDETELLRAFEEFNAWADATDGDALEITFVFKKDDTYLLALSPEISRLERRCVGYDRTCRIMVMTLCWVKPMDSTHPMLLEIRKYMAGFPTPFLFGGVRLPHLNAISRAAPTPVTEIPGLEPILKFEATFVDEQDVKIDSTAWIALQMASKRLGTRVDREPPPRRPSEIGKVRVKMLRTHFPVTLERLRRAEWFQAGCRDLRSRKVSQWQVEQAVCNLLLSIGLLGKPHFPGLSLKRLHRKVIDALRSRYELANGSHLPELPLGQVETQIMADVSALLHEQGKPRDIRDLPTAQAALTDAGLLEAPQATEPITPDRPHGLREEQ